jgi:putative tryptophan/tyrosine transport system substrate-binding protein
MKRRKFMTLLGGAAAAWPLAALAQERSQVVGVLSFGVPGDLPPAFIQALNEGGFVEGRNLAFELRFASRNFDRLPALADELVRQRVDLIFALGLPPALAAKAATSSTPIVFTMGEDPVKEGVVTSLDRPGGNATGFTGFANQLIAKRLELLHQAVPDATVIGFLVNPNNPNAAPDTKDAQAAVLAHGLGLRVLTAASAGEFEQAFATIAQERIGALLVGVEPFFWEQRQALTELAARHRVPAAYDRDIFPAVGGLMSYGTATAEGDRVTGNYVARILKGAKPPNLPVIQATKFQYIVNLKTAKALGITLPITVLALADRVIE